jgi:hypothetical protein
MALLGTDKNGREVRVVNEELYLKNNPCKPPIKKKAPTRNSKPKPKPVANKPKPPTSVKIDQATYDKIKSEVKKELKEELKKEHQAKHPSLEEANKAAMQGFFVGGLVGAVSTPELGGSGAVPGAASGALGGYLAYTFKHVLCGDQ